METFAVLLAEPELLRSPLLPEALAKLEGIPLADAARRVLVTWGTLLDKAPRDKAQALAEGLSAAGFAAVVVSQDRLAPLPDAQQASAAAFEASSVRWTIKPALTSLELPDADVLVLAAAAYRREVIRTVKVTEGPTTGQRMASLGIQLTTGLPIHIGGKKREVEKTEKSSDLGFHLELLAGSPARRVRVDVEDFNFACLGARMLYSAFPNFRALLAVLRERLPRARLNLGARVLLAGQPVNTLGYDTPADLEREERWLLALP